MNLLVFNLATDSDDPVLGFTTSWIKALASQVDEVKVISMRGGRIDLPSNVEFFSIGKEKGYSEPHRAFLFYRTLVRLVTQWDIHVCFSHMTPIFSVMGSPIFKAKRIPLITWYAHPSLTWTVRLAHRLSDRVVTSISPAYPYKHDHKLFAIGQGIDTDLFTPGGAGASSPATVLCVGRISNSKSIDTLIRAMGLLKTRGVTELRAVILGRPLTHADRNYVEELRTLTKHLGVEDIVTFKDAVSMTELPDWYRRCAIHVNLTPTGFGDKVALESMSCGCPCLVSNAGFAPTLGRFKDLLLFEYRNSLELADRIEALLDLPNSERSRIGLYLRDLVKEQHSLDGLSDTIITMSRSLLA